MSGKYVVLWSLFLIGSTTLACAKNKVPEWVTNRVSDAYYYVGVGYAPKVKKSTAHYDIAAKSALSDLASEISVNISSSTLLITIEDNKQLKDDFTSIIRARAAKEIEGYEKVASYEDKKGYWVYYRLSKSLYAANQEKKRQAAVDRATVYFMAAQDSEHCLDYKDAIIGYAKALDALKAYFNEQILIQVDGQMVNLIQRAYTRSAVLLNSITVEPLQSTITCKLGEPISEVVLGCKVLAQSQPIASFPVIMTYSERSVPNANKLTNEQGLTTFSIPSVRSKKSTETIILTLDKNAILLESAVDYVVRRWLLQTPVQEARVVISIIKPSVFIISEEQNLSQMILPLQLAPRLKNLFLNAGYFIATNQEQADYVVNIVTNTSTHSQSRGLYTSILNGQLQLYKNGQVILGRALNNINGTQLDFEKAGMNAYAEMVRLLEIRYFRELEDVILK